MTETARCIDCGMDYTDMGLDFSLPDQQWKWLCPENGILCANCMCKRAAKYSATIVLCWLDNMDYSLVPGHWQNKRRKRK